MAAARWAFAAAFCSVLPPGACRMCQRSSFSLFVLASRYLRMSFFHCWPWFVVALVIQSRDHPVSSIDKIFLRS